MAEQVVRKRPLKQITRRYIAGFASFEKINERINFINLVLLFLMMILIVVDVIGRSFFSKPLEGALELSEIIMVFLVFLSLGYTEIKGLHVRALTLVLRLSPRAQIVADFLDGVLGMIFFFLMALGGTLLAWESWTARQVSEGAEIPIYPGKFAIPVGCLLIFVVFLTGIVKSIRKRFKNSS